MALAGLVRWRGLAWAAELGSRLVRALDGYILENGDWDWYRMGAIVRQAGIPLSQPVLDFYASLKGFALIGNAGRMIEALLGVLPGQWRPCGSAVGGAPGAHSL